MISSIRLIDKRLFAAQSSLFRKSNATVTSVAVRHFMHSQNRPSLINSTIKACVCRGPSSIYRINVSAHFSTSSKTPDAENKNTANSEGNAGEASKQGENVKDIDRFNDDEYDDYEEPKTAGQKVRLYSIIFMRLLLLTLGAVCVYYTAQELFPGRNSPNSLFSEVFDILRVHDEVRGTTGEPMTAFGRDFGRNTEGRRNHVDSRKYKADDGSNRTRVRFNVKGPRGQFQVWAEVSDKMTNTEFVYLIVQDVRTGRVITIHDNRARLEAQYEQGIYYLNLSARAPLTYHIPSSTHLMIIDIQSSRQSLVHFSLVDVPNTLLTPSLPPFLPTPHPSPHDQLMLKD